MINRTGGHTQAAQQRTVALALSGNYCSLVVTIGHTMAMPM